jgi:polysaccharide biosynthesis/export protein
VKFPAYFCLLIFFGGLVSCASYKQNIMFKAENASPEPIKKEALDVERNYTIQKNDYLKLDVFTNNGERLIDPNPDMSQTAGGTQNSVNKKEFNFLVDLNGVAKFPMVGELKLEGLTLRQAEEILQKEYLRFFKEPFVILTYSNKRVIVLGATGGQVIPLTNQNIHLAEVLALAKGLDNLAKAHAIRVLRRDTFYQVDFSTIEGYRTGNLLIEPGDIVYVEPIRRPFAEGLRDNIGLFSLIVSLSSLLIIAATLK